MDSVSKTLEQARSAIGACAQLRELDDLRVFYLGKKGKITALLKSLGSMEPGQRKTFGQVVNSARSEITELLAGRKAALESEHLQYRLATEKVDVTLPGRGQSRGGLHPVTRAMQRINGLFAQLGFEVATGPEVEDDYFNFQSLNFPAHHPALRFTHLFRYGRMTGLAFAGKTQK